jgi:hypothetical protein
VGTVYSKCQTGITVNCDQGARATAVTSGDLNRQVYACASNATAAGLANPQVYEAVGVLYCGISSSLPGTYKVIYSVTSSNGVVVTATRTVVVFPVCESGTQLCSDGTCAAGKDWVLLILIQGFLG